MHGDVDELFLYNQSELLYSALRSHGHDVRMFKLEGEGHGTAGFYNLGIVREFFDNHLKYKGQT